MRILVATHNPGKLREFRALMGDDVEVVSPGDLDLGVPVEDGDTFEANAELKAKQSALSSGLLTIADDSGLVVDALDGAPGIHSARYAGKDATDANNRSLLLERITHVGQVNRQARFVCVIAICSGAGLCKSFLGEWEGRIATHARGSNGFGYDSIFELPDGRTAAELPALEKNAVSHRAIALRRALPYLRTLVSAR